MNDEVARPGHDRQSRIDFILANTRLFAPTLIPEIKLHLADECLPIWERSEIHFGETGLPPPFWAFAWAGGQALARYILDNPHIVAGKRILDLGSGSGLVAIAAMQAGAAHACAADIDAYSSVAASLNAIANIVVLDVAECDFLDTTPADIDVLLVGDLFYERGMADRVFAFITRMSACGALVLVGDPRRDYFPTEKFDTIAHYDVATSRDIEDSDVKPADVWRLRPV